MESPEFKKVTINTVKSLDDNSLSLIRKAERHFFKSLPDNRTFDVEITKEPGGIKVELKNTSSEQKINLTQFLPPDFRFAQGRRFECRSFAQEVLIPIQDLRYRGSLVKLFHEIGHANEHIEHMPPPYEAMGIIYGHIRSLLNELKNTLNQIAAVAQGKESSKAAHTKPENLLPVWYLDEKSKTQSQAERGAWAFALKSLRKLEKDGFDVFGEFGSVEEIKEYINFALLTYDLEYLGKKRLAGDKDYVDNPKNPFTRPRKGKINSEEK
ncbi:MAG: hypothetical protein HY226_05385 [Candidatus Vogelbacteria bacterium]|nr:hypothetical protein [Candidatus Vogelbacteria bacterium]